MTWRAIRLEHSLVIVVLQNVHLRTKNAGILRIAQVYYDKFAGYRLDECKGHPDINYSIHNGLFNRLTSYNELTKHTCTQIFNRTLRLKNR
jgi:hypothetical protein